MTSPGNFLTSAECKNHKQELDNFLGMCKILVIAQTLNQACFLKGFAVEGVKNRCMRILPQESWPSFRSLMVSVKSTL